MADEFSHRPVLFEEALAALHIRPDGIYMDGTFGRGGHAGGILERLGPAGHLLALDKDPQAVDTARRRFGQDSRFEIVRGSFATLERCVKERGWERQVDGILLDLGVSSPQLDDAGRGFSFRLDGALDMRMDPEQGQSAAEWLAVAAEREIARVLQEYGEERYAKRIARAIVNARSDAPITTTRRLAEIIKAAHPRWEPGKDPATQSFQAIRIHINAELDDLRAVLPQTLPALRPGGRLAVISFHSLEDRMVKRFIRDESRGDQFPPGLPVPQSALTPSLKAVGKAQYASEAEVAANPRARSAVLRVAERLI
jgi:16S rRNA (cytosine1402-N4)-methyltransferase